MADSRSNIGAYLGIAAFLMVAISALAAIKLNLFSIQDWLAGDSWDQQGRVVDRPTGKNGGAPDAARTDLFPETPPDGTQYKRDWEKPLPKRLSIRPDADGTRAEIEMLLVPQGWFIMGENDGVRSNMPRRWIWLDDFYLSATEITNQQFFLFVLANGYERPRFWTPEGFDFTASNALRGSAHIGWHGLGNPQLWALTSPDNETTIEVLDNEAREAVSECTLLVLPHAGSWAGYVRFDAVSRGFYLTYRDGERLVSGDAVARDARLIDAGYVHRTNKRGHVHLGRIDEGREHYVIAWPQGPDSSPVFGRLSRQKSARERGPEMPAVGLSWFEADACARFFGGLLPSEAQWEKAARGTDGRWYPWGSDLEWGIEIDDGRALRLSTPHANVNRWRLETVRFFPTGRGPYGHYNMVGNVSEWCLDVYRENPEWAEANPVNLGGAGQTRSQRGTSTQDDDQGVARVYNRRSSDPYSRGSWRGFRLAMSPEKALNLAESR